MFKLLIDNVDRTSIFRPEGASRREHLNERVDTFYFQVWKRDGTEDFVPNRNQVVELFFGDDRLFGGVVVLKTARQRRNYTEYNIECKDFTHFLDRLLVTERYVSQNLRQIVSDLVNRYANAGTDVFTLRKVPSDVLLDSITFNGIYLTQCFR